MSKLCPAPLISVLVAPARAASLSLADWASVLSLARAANLIAPLAALLAQARIDPPPAVKRHLTGMLDISERQHESVLWEVSQIREALAPLGQPIVLLKGAAYVLAGLPIARGRLFGDIDILVPRAALGAVELSLMTRGWTTAKPDPYDQRYYREWMHELPPMVHARRGAILDIHHNLLPLTSRHPPDPMQILAASRPLPDWAPLRLPCPEDLTLHCMAHLFHEGELHNGLRDLFDIHGLLSHYASHQPDFWACLINRAEALQLGECLYLGMHFSARFFGTVIPSAILATVERRWGHSALRRALLNVLYDRGLAPMHWACADPLTPLARWLLYVRAHALRMPMGLLLRHLSYKAWKSTLASFKREEAPSDPAAPR